MRRFRPVHAVALVAAVFAVVLGAQQLLYGNANRFTRVGPDAQGKVVLPVGELAPAEVRFYRFLNPGNQEVRFFVGRDETGALFAAFDASDNDFKLDRGFHADDGWIVNNKCTSSFRLSEIASHPSGCAPVPIAFARDGERVVITEDELLAGWRYFR
ncbi:MAG TPA: Fe-S-containing protein [Thermoanaerobaculia bacterium]|jgi:uncharacterized membrane protein